jgi:hypothetical protein
MCREPAVRVVLVVAGVLSVAMVLPWCHLSGKSQR